MLACILGNPGEIFFPKLNENQMKTFSSICDDFVVAQGLIKQECNNDEEAKQYAQNIETEYNNTYPVVYSKSDTTGEKAFEEFFVPGEKINMERFKSLGVVEESARRSMEEIDAFFAELEEIFKSDKFTKNDVICALKRFIPSFQHEEKSKYLDQKM